MLYRFLGLSGLLIFVFTSAFSQNVGIGSVNPVTRLDIVSGNNWDVANGPGDIHLGANGVHLRIGMATGGGGIGATGIMQYGLNGGYNVLSLGAQGQYLLQLNGTSGKVGIGTDSPEGKLEVNSTSSFPQLSLMQGSASDYARIRFKNSNSVSNTRYFDIATYISSTAQALDKLSLFHSVAGDVLNIMGDGNAGMGTAAPTARLEVASGTGSPQQVITQTNGADYVRLRLRNNNSLTNNRNWDFGGFISSSAAAADRFVLYNPGAGNILTITGDGLTGLGSSNPAGKLDVNSTGSIPQLQLVQGSAGDYSRMRLKNGNSAASGRYYDVAAFISNTGAADDRLNFFSYGYGDILGLAGNGAYYVNGSAGSSGMVLKSNGASAAATWSYSPSYYTSAPDPSPYITLLDNIVGYTFSNIGQTITLPVASLVLVSASFNGDVTSCAFCGPGLNEIVLIIDGVTISNKPYLLSAPSGGYTNVTISNYPLRLSAGTHTIQFRAEHITPSTNTNVQAIYSTVAVVPN